MVKYSREPENPVKSAKARASDLRTSFKNMRETAMAIKGMELTSARTYLNKVLEKKDVIPLRRFGGSAGRSNLCKIHNHYGPGRCAIFCVHPVAEQDRTRQPISVFTNPDHHVLGLTMFCPGTPRSR